MKSISQHPSLDKPTRHELQSAAEARISEPRAAADGLFAQTADADPATAGMLRCESAQLCSIAFEATRRLCYGDPESAYRVCCVDDANDEKLRLTA